MNLKAINIQNFRRLKNVLIDLDSHTSIFVGPNNSGKTSATHILQMMLGEGTEKISLHDFSAHCWKEFDALEAFQGDGTEVLPDIPKIILDLWFVVSEADLHRVIDLLPSLDWNGTWLGVRVEYAVKDTRQLVFNYRHAKKKSDPKKEGEDFRPWPKNMTDYLSKRLNAEFEKRYYVLDRSQFDEKLIPQAGYLPVPLGDQDKSGAKILKSLIRIDFLSAQRHMADTSTSRSEDLSRRLSRFYERNLEQQSDDENIDALRSLSSSEAQLNSHLAKVFEQTIRQLSELGYPGFHDPQLVIKTTLNPESILKQGAQVHYAIAAGDDSLKNLILPDKYNGLGFKNLIYMVIEVLDFRARWVQEKEDRPPLHLVIIEEPEAHLHAQIQQVFIRQIRKILPPDGAFSTQLVVTTHSPHIIYESGFTPIRYFRRSVKPGHTSEVLNLSEFHSSSADMTREFLQKYMKLTHCDLFFADAIVLVEGNVERLLLPLMIEKAAPGLRSDYLSILEVGGAFAHRFRELLEFLGQTTLVITDLDSVKPSAPAAQEDAEDDDLIETKGGDSCMVNTENAVTSNETLKQWLPKLSKVSELLTVDEKAKTEVLSKNSDCSVRICYQLAHEVSLNQETTELCGRTLEESFALENLSWCQAIEQKDLQLRIKSSDKLSLAEVAERIFKRVNSSSFKKTDFALCLMTKDANDWKVPFYIDQGLQWLDGQCRVRRNRGTQDSDLSKLK